MKKHPLMGQPIGHATVAHDASQVMEVDKRMKSSIDMQKTSKLKESAIESRDRSSRNLRRSARKVGLPQTAHRH